MKSSIKTKLNLSKYFLLLAISILTFLLSCESEQYMFVEPIEIDSSCDTNNVSYSKFIQPLMLQCQPCHNYANSKNGINLDDYNNIRINSLNGKILGSLRGGTMSGYFNRTDCDYVKLQAWINQGSKNN